MITRRQLGQLGLALSAAGMWRSTARAEAKRVEPTMNDDGLHTQTWFTNSFLDLKDDLQEARAAGKRLALIFEQRGCPYCKETHEVNFADPAINDYVRGNFHIIQLNLWGARPVTDFDGQQIEERAFARKLGVIYTPTIVFLPESDAGQAGKGAKELEVMRMPGYFKPFHFVSVFEFVRSRGYETEHFQKWIQAKADRLRAEGKEVKLW
jgi:thioredoxin-related protein